MYPYRTTEIGISGGRKLAIRWLQGSPLLLWRGREPPIDPETLGSCADPEGPVTLTPPLENLKAIYFLRNTGPDPLEFHNATHPWTN